MREEGEANKDMRHTEELKTPSEGTKCTHLFERRRSGRGTKNLDERGDVKTRDLLLTKIPGSLIP